MWNESCRVGDGGSMQWFSGTRREEVRSGACSRDCRIRAATNIYFCGRFICLDQSISCFVKTDNACFTNAETRSLNAFFVLTSMIFNYLNA